MLVKRETKRGDIGNGGNGAEAMTGENVVEG
jgi:hypothetical protein